jgi:hypothetical protein
VGRGRVNNNLWYDGVSRNAFFQVFFDCQGLKTARTIITMMISRMMMPMHSHFLEFF